MTLPDITLFRGLVFWGGFALLLAAETVRPYRRPSVSKLKRLMTNISLTAVNSAVLSLAFASATINTALHVSSNHLGLLNMLSMGFWYKVVIAVVFLDFILYILHILNHRVPLLWRFHRVHHSDINMDVSTAARFHIGELAVSSVVKICAIYFSGANLASVIIFESLLLLSAQFQHSSIKVPAWFEEVFRYLFVPPSMHRIHHSVKIPERDTNYGTILSVWDRMLGTLLKDVEQEGIIIGLGSYREPDRLRLHNLLFMPFSRAVR